METAACNSTCVPHLPKHSIAVMCSLKFPVKIRGLKQDLFIEMNFTSSDLNFECAV